MVLKKKKRSASASKKKIIKKKPLKKVVAKKPVAKKKPSSPPAKSSKKPKKKEFLLGEITHYFTQVRAAVIKLKSPVLVGDTIRIKGFTTDFKQKIISMQIDRVSIQKAKKGDEIGLLVDSRVRTKDKVYKV
ncbi:MAG: hypothetical protein WDL87_00205 [Candidatus Omnitrophota bacterium]|jgi:hypothetical protein